MMLLIWCIFSFNSIIIHGAILRLPSITVKEQSSIGSSVSDISRTYLNRSQKLRYTFLSETSPHNSYFIIDSLTGKISIKRVIDREELCRTNTCNCEKCILNLEIVASADTVDILSLEVLIENINDHDPMFPVSTFIIRISENTDIGYMASFPSAIDLDYGQGQSSNYLQYKMLSIETNDKDLDETFQIIDLHTENQLGLKLLKKLDREIRNLYRMKIIVFDSIDENQQRTGILLLDVQVLDSNDNLPIFEHEQYHIKLRENTRIGTEILRVHAIDNDDGLNSLINYTIVINNSSILYQQLLPFSINISTGILRLDKLLDYETETNYRFSVRAQDNGPESVNVFCQIKIDILDVNDMAPEIDFILSDNDEWKIDSINNIFYINEELKLYTRLFHISVSDKDSVNDKVQLNLLSYTNLFQLIEQYTDLYSLQIIGRLDREIQSEYKLIFEAKDQPSPGNGPSLSTQKRLTIILLDINDNYPIIEKLQYPISVIENNSIGVKLIQFQSSDIDSTGNNSLLTYTLVSSNDSQCCLLDSKTGILYANMTYDYEKQTIYYLTLQVNDNGKPPLHTLMDFQVYINNSNDNSPIFKQKNFTFELFENVPIHTYIGQVNAIDLDSGEYGKVKYELLCTQLYNEPEYIEISPITGVLRTKTLLDYETHPVHKLYVIAKDINGQSDTALITINILDINDNSPQIDFPTSINNLVYISSDLLNQNYSQTILITKIIAIDRDHGQNGNLSYTIDDGNTFNYFRIIETNGTILAQSDNLPYGHHRLRIRVTDQGWPSLSTLTYLNIKVGEHVNIKHFQLVNTEQQLLSESRTETTITTNINNILTKEMLFVVIISSILTLIFSISIGILITLLCKRKRFHMLKSIDLLSDGDKLLTVGTTTTNGTDINNKTNTLKVPLNNQQYDNGNGDCDVSKDGNKGYDDILGMVINSEDSCYGSNDLSRSSSSAHGVAIASTRPLLNTYHRSSSLSSTSVDYAVPIPRINKNNVLVGIHNSDNIKNDIDNNTQQQQQQQQQNLSTTFHSPSSTPVIIDHPKQSTCLLFDNNKTSLHSTSEKNIKNSNSINTISSNNYHGVNLKKTVAALNARKTINNNSNNSDLMNTSTYLPYDSIDYQLDKSFVDSNNREYSI